jgi:diketogulonate reductase-like aldo/keto reductase
LQLWNTFHRPDLVVPVCKKTLEKMGLDYLDLYLMHCPIALKVRIWRRICTTGGLLLTQYGTYDLLKLSEVTDCPV